MLKRQILHRKRQHSDNQIPLRLINRCTLHTDLLISELYKELVKHIAQQNPLNHLKMMLLLDLVLRVHNQQRFDEVDLQHLVLA